MEIKKYYTDHMKDRTARYDFIEKNIGFGEAVAVTVHKAETADRIRRNVLTDTGIVYVYPMHNWKLVTVFIAQYSQACAIYRKCHGTEAPEWMKDNFRTADRWKEWEP